MTRAEKLLLALSDIRPDWVLDAAPKNTLPETGPRPRRSKVKYWGAAGALAACLLLAFWGREALGGGTPPAARPTDAARGRGLPCPDRCGLPRPGKRCAFQRPAPQRRGAGRTAGRAGHGAGQAAAARRRHGGRGHGL